MEDDRKESERHLDRWVPGQTLVVEQRKNCREGHRNERFHRVERKNPGG